MLTASDKATPDSDVIVTELDGEAVLLNLDTKLYFSLNATGVRIWKLLAEGLTLGQIGDRLFHALLVERDVDSMVLCVPASAIKHLG